MANRNTDWFDVLFRNAVTHTHNLSINGGQRLQNITFPQVTITIKVGQKGSVSERFTNVGSCGCICR